MERLSHHRLIRYTSRDRNAQKIARIVKVMQREVCRSVSRELCGSATDGRLHRLNNTRQLYGYFLLWENHYIGELRAEVKQDCIVAIFVPNKP